MIYWAGEDEKGSRSGEGGRRRGGGRREVGRGPSDLFKAALRPVYPRTRLV